MGRAGAGTADEIRAEKGRDYPGWHPWQSSAGRWWAVRRTSGPPLGAPDEWARTVDADTPEGLRIVLAGQEGFAREGHAVRFREDRPGDLDRARAAVTVWRGRNPGGTSEQLAAAIGHQFHPDYGVVLRALLFAADRHQARQVTGITTQNAGTAW